MVRELRFTRERGVLTAILATGLGLTSAHLASAPIGGYYATAVRSMSESWHAWFFGALDPGATITVDKVPGWLQLQALSVRVFGFYGWAIELPQVVAGTAATIALYVAVRRWRGVPAAQCAAGLFVLAPIVVPTFAHSMEDGPLACCLILALDRAHAAVVSGRLRSLLAASLWIAVGFGMKMGQAWVILPIIVVVYACWAPVERRVRVVQAAVAALLALVGSFVWVATVALVPAGSRPYVDGTCNNNPYTMVLGYNGLERFGIHLPCSMPQALRLAHPDFVPGDGWAKLLAGHLLPQVGWLLPLAVVGLIVGWRTHPRDRAGYALWGGALLAYALIFSAAGLIPHAAYVVVLAAPIAALVGAFLVDLPRLPWRVQAGVVLAQAGWTAWVWAVEPNFVMWLRWGAVVLALGLLVSLRRLPVRMLAAALVGVLAIGPITWSASTLNSSYAGSDTEATAGPPGHILAGAVTPAHRAMGGPEGADFIDPGPALSGDAAEVWSLAKTRQGTARIPLVTVGEYLARPFILATGEPVLPTGGYSLRVDAPSVGEFVALVESGQARMVLLGAGALRGAAEDNSANADIVRWSVGHCELIKTWAYPRTGPLEAGVELLDCGVRH